MKKSDKTLQEALVRHNLLSEKEFKNFLNDTSSTDESLREFLIRKDIVTEKQILIALSQTSSLDTVNLRDLSIDSDIFENVPTKFAWYYRIFPVSLSGNILTVASAYPLDIQVEDEIRINVGYNLKVVLAEEQQIIDALKKYYGLASETIDRIITKDPKALDAVEDHDQWIEDIEHTTDDPTISHLVNEIIVEAYRKRATDIHIEPYRNKVRFRYRIDGVLVDANLPENVWHFLPQILSRIKILANLSITEKRLPQDGSAVVRTRDQHLDLRVSTMPTPRGESIVIRILPTKVMLFSLEKLGFNKDSVNYFRKLITKPHGIIFITGPTGSGKTTTLYACLNEINSSERKIITIEDPVEYEMDSITQVQVNPKVNFTFSTGLRSILRHDPDIIMVGEVRDPETAEIAIKTALTGHLVFSTLHTNDAASGITRLIDMGVEPYLVSSSVEAFVAQRLVRVICPKCKIPDPEPIAGIKEEVIRSLCLNADEEIVIYKGAGCDYCNHTGYYGRMAVYEILMLNDAIRAAILDKPRSDYIKRIAIDEGLITLRQNGWKAVADGLTTPEEVLNVTVKDDESFLKKDVNKKKVKNEDRESMSILSDFHLKNLKTTLLNNSEEEEQQRDSHRARLPLKILYSTIHKDEPISNPISDDVIQYPAVCDNISIGGICLMTQNKLEIGQVISVEFELPQVEKPIQCFAEVCRVSPHEYSSKFKVGAFFLNLEESIKGLIHNFIKKRCAEHDQITR